MESELEMDHIDPVKDNDKWSLTDSCSDDLIITQFESLTKKVFTSIKTPRVYLPSDTESENG